MLYKIYNLYIVVCTKGLNCTMSCVQNVCIVKHYVCTKGMHRTTFRTVQRVCVVQKI